MFHLRRLMLILAMLVLLADCAAAPAAPAVQCRIVLESSPAFTAQTQTAAVTPGQSVNFTLTPADGYTLTGADYPGASLTRTGAAYILTLPDVRYSVAVAVTAEKSDTVLYYNDNCGGGWVTVPVTASHLRLNTAIDDALFTRPGYTLTGWNTAPDGSGQAVGLGSRTEPGARLYAQWAAQNDAAEFTYTVENDAAAITGWQGEGEVLVIPDTLGGAPVVEIAAGAFADAPCKTVIFPDTLRRVQPGAFSGSAAESVTLFDNLQQISDYAFEDCTSLQTLYINAATVPVYSGSYYATFADKYDRLLSLADTQKLRGVGRCAWCAAAFGKGPDPLRRKAQGPHLDRRVPTPRLYIFSGLHRLGLFPGSLCLGCPSAAVPPACRLVAEHTAHNAAEHRYTAGGRACFGGALPASAARDVVRSTVPAQRIGLLSLGIDCGRRVVFHTAHGHDQCLYLLPILTLP